ncbi:hypothetical protein [Actinomadura roseirufa]|nr:hypothetical protein [Actinomadura roseirufa]
MDAPPTLAAPFPEAEPITVLRARHARPAPRDLAGNAPPHPARPGPGHAK